ncbi:ATP-binding cassette sub-family C member 9-like [Acanthaster planci]|uniref:ATP-binding cassette sub-family C member 9-like n=1 Tax=Acanthaster planci TaxID=133434 RepID=A0A8B7XNH6_ACAPL|nr:ATP-binding cassette sub-family C member 9-like [Acanthaster planci]
MTKIYLKVYGRRLFAAAVLKLIGDVFGFINPLAVGALTVYVTSIKYASAEQTSPAHFVTVGEFFANGFVLVAVMFLVSTLKFFCIQTYVYIIVIEAMNMRSALQAMVYEKSLRLSTFATAGKMNMGQITNHMSVDPMVIQQMFQSVNYLWSVPVQLAVNLLLLYFQMGFPALIGACVFFIITPVQFKMMSVITKRQEDLLLCSDERLKQVNELLQGIRLLKLYAWEEWYCQGVEAVRARELACLMKITGATISTILLTSTAPVLVTLVGFGTYSALTGKTLTPDVTFSSLSLFNMLGTPLTMVPTALLLLVNGVVSSRRVLNFLLAPEVEVSCRPDIEEARDDEPACAETKLGRESWTSVEGTYDNSTETTSLLSSGSSDSSQAKYGIGSPGRSLRQDEPRDLPPGVAVKVTDASFLWDLDSCLPVLSDINLEIPEGKLTIIIGQVGSGKSSLISAILGEMSTLYGKVQIRENAEIALAAQKPWLLNVTLKENILFSKSLDEKRYDLVLDSCALKPDIDILPARDQTEIGEKGINLSGGQKQRVSVARAMYSNRDVIILDDPLSALDVHVGRHLFEEGIMKLLVKRRHTVILVTHQLQYLNRADLIIVMKDGRITARGDLDDIIASDPVMYSEYHKAVRVASESETETSSLDSGSITEERRQLQQRVRSAFLVNQISDAAETASGSLIKKEEMERGSISCGVYLYYARNVGSWLVLLIAVTAVANTALSITTNFWLSAWSEAGLGNESVSISDQYFIGYLGLSVGYLLVKSTTSTLLVVGLLIAARRLHQKMLRNLIRVPIRFFDTTPVGRILNRFSSDTKLIDSRLTQTMITLLGSSLRVLSAVIVNTIVMPLFLVFFLPVTVVYLILQWYFLASSRELQRLDSISRSPVFALFSETLSGLTTIRAYRAGRRFYGNLLERIDTNLTAFLYLQVANRWLALRLDAIGTFMVLLAGLLSLIGALTMDLDPSLVGLAVTYSLQVSSYLNYLVRGVADTEMQMNGVERVKHFTCVANEKYEGSEPSPDWPQKGRIELQHVSVRYAEDWDPVLHDVTVEFKAGEKVGICGRTGAGKSSLSLALLRAVDIFDGSILIDGVDIKSVPLKTLRSKVSIIPQDPVLFTGSIRTNLDPHGRHSEAELWDALEVSQLRGMVCQLGEGLDSVVTEGGENFSVGQRQLFCLARAFLRKSRILIMDEATASVDMETDKLLQQVVLSSFADRTVLTIAHRISSIINSDSILVLDHGRTAEYGTPSSLLEKGGLLASFVKDKNGS